MPANIHIASEAGACYGVERALELTLQAASTGPEPVFTLGPLIHNPRVVRDLESRGVRVANSPMDAQGGTLILRTHGVTPEEEELAKKLCAQVIDATCPFVKRCHKAAEQLAKEGFQVVIVGEKGHPEVLGTLGHVPSALVISSQEEARSQAFPERVGIVVQTTQARSNFDSIVSAISANCNDVSVVNTICEATSKHQAAAVELASRVDVMIVIGGKNSANTTHLADLSREVCKHTYHIESEDELEATWFANVASVGITAGASTPASQIEDVRQAIEALVGK